MASPLSPEQQRTVAQWVRSGLGLAEVQKRLAADFGLNLTYRDVRFLVDDLQLDLPEAPPAPAPKAAAPLPPTPPAKGGPTAPAKPGPKGPPPPPAYDEVVDEDEDAAAAGFGAPPPGMADPFGAAPGGKGAKVSVEIDRLARPGMMVSGSVTFSDGQKGQWYVDQYGRLGLNPATKGYQPGPADIQAFQLELDRELQKRGF